MLDKKGDELELLVENVLNIGDDEFYRASRYSHPLTVVLLNCDDKKAFEYIEKHIRQTDIIQQLSSDLLLLLLPHTNHENSILLLDKLKEKIDFTYISREFKEPKEKFIEQIFLDNL